MPPTPGLDAPGTSTVVTSPFGLRSPLERRGVAVQADGRAAIVNVVWQCRRTERPWGRDTLVDLLGQGRPGGPALLDQMVAHADEVSDDLAVCVLRRPERRA